MRTVMVGLGCPSRLTAVLLLLCLLLPSTCGTCDVDTCIGVVKSHHIELTDAQRTQIAEESTRIAELKTTCEGSILACEESTAPSIVEFTTEQKGEILARYGRFFGDTVKPVVVEDDDNGDRRRRATSVGSFRYVCPPAGDYRGIRFALNILGQILQMVQIDNEAYQWVFTETCSSTASDDVPGVICFERQRFIPAVVVNLETELIDVEEVQVACCTAGTDTAVP